MFHHSEADVKKIKAVQFGIISPEECKAMSVLCGFFEEIRSRSSRQGEQRVTDYHVERFAI